MNRFIYSHNSSTLPNFIKNEQIEGNSNISKNIKSLPSFSLSNSRSLSMRSHHLYSYPLKKSFVNKKIFPNTFINSLQQPNNNKPCSSQIFENNSVEPQGVNLSDSVNQNDILVQEEKTDIHSVSISSINQTNTPEFKQKPIDNLQDGIQSEQIETSCITNINTSVIEENNNESQNDQSISSEPQLDIENTDIDTFFYTNHQSSPNCYQEIEYSGQRYSDMNSLIQSNRSNSFNMQPNEILSCHIQQLEENSELLSQETEPLYFNSNSGTHNRNLNLYNRNNSNSVNLTRCSNRFSVFSESPDLRDRSNYFFNENINNFRTQSYSRSSTQNIDSDSLQRYNFPSRSQSSSDRIITTSSRLLTPLPNLFNTNTQSSFDNMYRPYTIFSTNEIDTIPNIYVPRVNYEDNLYMFTRSPFLGESRFQHNLIFYIHPDSEPERRGVDSTVIDIMPIEKFNKNINYNEALRTCGICSMEYEHDEGLRRLPCCHAFHKDCIDLWLEDHTSCPLCRFDINDGINLTQESSM